MSNTPAPESAPEAGTGGTPTPTISSPSVGQPPSGQTGQPALDYDALVDKLMANPKFASSLTKTVQSVKDKRFSEFDRIKTYLDAHGGDVEKAKREMVLDEMVNQFGQELPGRDAPAQTNQNDIQSKTAALLTEFGITNDDPELAEMSRKQYATEFEWLQDVSKLGARRLRGEAPPPRSANLATNGSSSPAVPKNETKEQKRDRLSAELATMTQQPGLVSFETLTAKNKELTDLLKG